MCSFYAADLQARMPIDFIEINREKTCRSTSLDSTVLIISFAWQRKWLGQLKRIVQIWNGTFGRNAKDALVDIILDTSNIDSEKKKKKTD